MTLFFICTFFPYIKKILGSIEKIAFITNYEIYKNDNLFNQILFDQFINII